MGGIIEQKDYLNKKKAFYSNKNFEKTQDYYNSTITAKTKYKSQITLESEKSQKKFVENDLCPNLWRVVYKVA